MERPQDPMLLGMAKSSAAIATPDSQLTTMRIRSTKFAIGRAGEEAGFDMVRYLGFTEYQYVIYRISSSIALIIDKTF
jgi:hypothetical protein